MARGERTDIEMLGKVDVSTGEGVSSPAIQNALAKLYGRSAPGLRTVQERVKEFRAQSTGDLWTLADTDDSAEALHILDVRRAWVLSNYLKTVRRQTRRYHSSPQASCNRPRKLDAFLS